MEKADVKITLSEFEEAECFCVFFVVFCFRATNYFGRGNLTAKHGHSVSVSHHLDMGNRF